MNDHYWQLALVAFNILGAVCGILTLIILIARMV